MLAIEPTHSAALAGRARAERLPEVQELVQRANVEVARGELDGGALDVPRGARDRRRLAGGARGRRRRQSHAARRGVRAVVVGGFRLARRRGLRGRAPRVRGGARDAARLARSRRRSRASRAKARSSSRSRCPRFAALAFERRELWDEAIELYRSVLASDGTLLFAQTGLERARARAGLDAKLVNLIDNPTLLFGDAVLADARALLDAAAAEAEKGPRLDVADRAARASSSSSRRSRSQCASNRISSRASRCIASARSARSPPRKSSCAPARIPSIGSRDGYRDVRQTFTVRPGRNLAADQTGLRRADLGARRDRVTQATSDSGRKSIVTVEERGRRHDFGAAELPVTLGAGHDADVALEGVTGSIQIGRFKDAFFVQAGRGARNLRVGGEPLTGTRELQGRRRHRVRPCAARVPRGRRRHARAAHRVGRHGGRYGAAGSRSARARSPAARPTWRSRRSRSSRVRRAK